LILIAEMPNNPFVQCERGRDTPALVPDDSLNHETPKVGFYEFLYTKCKEISNRCFITILIKKQKYRNSSI